MYLKNTKIVCTLGPSSNSVSELIELVQAGMNVARLNFSHGTYEEHLSIIKNLRIVEKKTGKRIGILQDLQGPKIRLGKMPEKGILVVKGEKIILTIKSIVGKRERDHIIIPVQYKNIIKDAKKDDTILLDDGLIELTAESIKNNLIYCRVKNGGIIKTYKGLSIPTTVITAPTLTPKDKKDLQFGLKNNVDFIALSFVKDSQDIEHLRSLIKEQKKDTPIIAKIERNEAIENLEEIIKSTDGVMVARGDLGVNISPEKVPVIQKKIIKLANRYCKPVITATQVLHSMIENPVPTRAEVSDAANSIFDHTDAIMLSNETAVGKFPSKAVRVLSKVAESVEEELQKHEELIENELIDSKNNILNATCLSACQLASDMKVDKLIIYTDDGYTAKQISRHRTYIHTVTITPSQKTARELTLLWGLNEIYIAKLNTKKTSDILKFLKRKKIVKKGQKIVIICHASNKENLITSLRI